MENDKKTCCDLRRKIMINILGVLPESACGVPDSALADVMRWDLEAPDGKTPIGVRFCPWCGTMITDNHEVRIVGGIQIAKDKDGGVDEGESFPD